MTRTSAASDRRTPFGWYYGWNIVAAAILSQVAANGLTWNAFPLFLPDWSRELHAPVSQLQLNVAGMLLVASIVSPPIGALADRLPARRIFSTGLIGMALFYAAVSFVTAAWQILALYCLLAPIALTAATAIPSNALISRWFVRRRGLALGLSAFGIGMAGVVLPPIVAALLPDIGWRLIWRAGAALLALAVTPLVVLILRDRPTEREGLHYLAETVGGARAAHDAAAGGPQLSWRAIASRRNFWLLVGIYLPMLALFAACAQNLAPFAQSHGWSRQSAGVLLSVLSFSHLAGTLALGVISDRFGTRLPFVGLALVMAAGAVMVALGGGLPLIALGCVFIGLGGGLYPLLGAALAVEFGADGFGRAYGLAMLFLPAMSLAPFAVAKSQEISGAYTPAFLALAVLTAAAGGLSLLLREGRREDARPSGRDMAGEAPASPVP